jgi:hypothetical protein
VAGYSFVHMTYLGEKNGLTRFFVLSLTDPRSLLPVLVNAEVELIPPVTVRWSRYRD